MEGFEPTSELPAAGPPRSPWRAVAIVVSVLLVAAVAAAAVLIGDDDDEQQVATEGGTAATTSPTSTTAPVTSTTTPPDTTTTAAPAAAATSTTAAPTTTTTAKPRKPAFSITPSSGPPLTQAEAAGTGCTGQDAGIELTMLQPSGEPYTGDGAAAMPDGSWRVPFSYPSGPAGRWTMKASCKARGGALVVEYEPQTFTVT